MTQSLTGNNYMTSETLNHKSNLSKAFNKRMSAALDPVMTTVIDSVITDSFVHGSGVAKVSLSDTEPYLSYQYVDKHDFQVDHELQKFKEYLSRKDLNLIREWFDSVQDVNPQYLQEKDYQLGKSIYTVLGMRIPSSMKDK